MDSVSSMRATPVPIRRQDCGPFRPMAAAARRNPYLLRDTFIRSGGQSMEGSCWRFTSKKTKLITTLSDGRPAEPDSFEPVVATPTDEGIWGATLSPDGRWIAYTSNQTGQVEIWVRPYPGPGAPVRVSPSGGTEPVWARNGRELYYLEGDASRRGEADRQVDSRCRGLQR